MSTLLFTLAVIVGLGALAYKRASLISFTGAIALALGVLTFTHGVNNLVWIAFVVIAVPLNITSFRQQYISVHLLKLYRSIMPEMSRTEKEAIDAGTTWWEADLFKGSPNWEKLHNYPAPRLSPDEQAFLDGPVEEACAMANEHEICHEQTDLPEPLWQFLKDNGFFAMIIKKKYGGLEFSAYAQSRVLQKLSGVSTVLASTVGVPNSLGPGELLQHYGTEEQKDHYLPRLADGREIPCFALTSPEAGSDAGAIPDRGVVCKGMWNGEEVLGMRITWNKRYITLAPVATVLGLAFKLDDPDNLLGDEKDLGITCALIPTDVEGVEIGRRHFPLNVMFQNGPTRGNDVFFPLDFIIGGPSMAGRGWQMLVECLSVGRGITLPSNSAGGVKTLALASGAYSRIRRQFKLPIGKMEGVEEPLARIGGNAYLMDAVTTMTTGAIDLGEKPSVVSAIVKYHLTDRMQSCVIDAMDIHGGKGICLGPNNYVGRGYQGAPIAITVEGANILTRSLIIYGQGAIRCHPYVLAELDAANEKDDRLALEAFDKAVFGHIGFAISNFARSLWLGLTNSRFSAAPFKDETKRYYQHMNRFSANLAFLSDIAMASLGGDLKRKERISARLGDILSQLYLTSATLKRYDDEGRQQGDLALVHWAARDSLFKAQTALDELLRNFPIKWVGKLLRYVMYPTGITLVAPYDELDHEISRLLQAPGVTRDRLGAGQYWKPTQYNTVGIQEETLLDVIAAEAIIAKISKATGQKEQLIFLDKLANRALEIGCITEEEAEHLRKTEQGRLKSINVDDFDPLDLVPNSKG
ncbi:acyl-CoA dehydrogenase FadE [Psychrobium sp. 1_MG-2023]|uniref:acyl-CoA dehydrogenase FadE n=1 Tax=Psychrobium sp. 1_MG-2023 TaxID=3062624 RepID=UPI000C33ABB5|nr:acyl-CoA dehydrogenase FadE [Psychrobium sp. 1_MG-2023]MDP2560112.1 acyl-CoA dehydrogenase FadE [Psychrobium sp. 1_MG-2023]PKF56927.1 acyl-CoA dehydrogenase [Alteromonadales bacterium alter-6D02]